MFSFCGRVSSIDLFLFVVLSPGPDVPKLDITNPPRATPRLGAQQVDFDAEYAQRQQRVDKLNRLLDVAQGDWSDRTRVIHHCTAAGRCDCVNRESSVDLIFTALSEAFLTFRPVIPAANKWTKLLPPMGWWMFACAWHGVVAESMTVARDLLVDPSEQVDVAAINIMGMDDQQQYP